MSENIRTSCSPRATRRDVLRQGAGLAAGVALTSLVRPVHAAGTDTLKIALIGCGNRGTGAAAQALQTEGPVVLYAMADAFADRLEQSYGLLKNGGALKGNQLVEAQSSKVDVAPERRFVGLEAYKQAVDAVDVVILTGPPGFRPEQFEYAVRQGKHVFMEKPVATDGPGIRRVLAAGELAKSKGLKVGVGLQRHHEPKYLETVQRLRDGAIGDFRMLRCYWNGLTAKIPYDRAGLTELEYQVRNWYFFSWLSGDHNVEQHVHNLDVCNWLVGGTPVSAAGVGGRQVRVGKDWGNIFDHHAVEYTYANGLKMFSVCRQIPGCEPLVGEFAVGTKGEADVGNAVITVDGQEAWKFPRPRVSSRARFEAGQNPYQLEHDALFAAIRSDKPHNEVTAGAEATMTAILGRMATYTGRTVTWDEGINSTTSLAPTGRSWDSEPSVKPDLAGLYPLPVPGVLKEV